MRARQLIDQARIASEETLMPAQAISKSVLITGARILLGLKWLLPDRAFDSLLRLQLRSFSA